MAGSRLPILALIVGSLCGCQSPVSLRNVSYSPLAPIEESVVFHPSRYPEGDWQPRGLNFEDAWFKSADGTRLHGWFVEDEHPRAVVLFCHGNGGNVANWADELRVLHDRVGVTAMLFDYRGYGRSDGVPTEEGVLADARAARRWLANRVGIPESEIVVMGRSLGGAVAVDLATDGARGLIIESTYLDARRRPRDVSVAANAFGDADPVRLDLQDRQISRPAITESWHGRPPVAI